MLAGGGASSEIPAMPSQPPAVSVLLPVRDGAAHLPECIASLRAQTLADSEVIAVDDGSADGTPELLDAWAAADRRVRVVRQGASGLVAALETARGEARGRYLARMDADDVAAPRRLARQLALMEGAADLVACGCRTRYFPETLVQGGALRYEAWINGLIAPDEIERDLFVECPIAHPTFFLRADAVAAVGGYRDRGWPEDYDLLLRLWETGGRFAKVPETLLRWREGTGRLSRVDPAYGPDAFRRLKVHFLARTLLAGRDGAVVWGAGPTGKSFARALLAEGALLRAFVDLDPRKIGQTVHGAPVVSPHEIERYRGALCLAAVGQAGAREEIRSTLSGLGWSDGVDFVCVA
jgi:glycosyltransferase involved in cell wall biosynthesis